MENRNILAIVEGREITGQDVDMLVSGLDPQSAAQFNTKDGRQRLVNELVNQELLYLDALDNEMQLDAEYVDEVEKAKINILKQYAISKLLKTASVEEGEVIGFYNSHKEYFKNPENIRASHILVESLEKANEILCEIKNGLSFEDAAKKYSSCPSNKAGGDLGYFKRGSMVPEFEEAAFGMKIGEISQPVKTQFGFHIIKLTDRKEDRQKSLDEVKDQIVKQILLKKQQDLYIKKCDELKSKYEVKIL